jgi:N-acetylmuramoyl-L-alanine amidase
MKFAISSGHGKYIRGAAGSPVPPYLDEVDEARKVVDRIAQILKDGGVTVVTFHDNTSHDQNTNLNTIVNWHNAQARDLDVSVHFNAYQTTSKPMGCEVLYVSQSSLASKVSQAIADAGHFINRGPKKRTDLFFLNKTHEPAILLEVCFVDSKVDADLYHQHFEAICHAIAEAISGEALTAPPDRPPESERPPPASAGRRPGDCSMNSTGAMLRATMVSMTSSAKQSTIPSKYQASSPSAGQIAAKRRPAITRAWRRHLRMRWRA